MKTFRIEFKVIDARRWAFLHIPLGVILGIYHAIWFVSQEQPGSIETPFVLLLGTPIVVVTVCFVAWFQAILINGFIGIMGCGPVVYAQGVKVEPHKISLC